MENLTVERKITVNFTPQQWYIFTSVEGHQEAANNLNKALHYFVTEYGLPRHKVELAMYEFMGTLTEYGATDTEPRGFLKKVLDEIFSFDDNTRPLGHDPEEWAAKKRAEQPPKAIKQQIGPEIHEKIKSMFEPT